MAEIGFTSIFEFILKLYDLLNVSSFLIWDWFTSPIGVDVAEFLNIPLDTTNLELMLGTFVPVMLALTLVGFILKAIKPI